MWPMHTIKELLERAQSHGFSEVSLSSRKEAELFRYSIKNYKQRYKVGQNLATKITTRPAEDGKVHYYVEVFTRPEVRITA